jgi:hypothetical protein
MTEQPDIPESSIDLDGVSLTQALIDFEIANARVLDLTRRLTTLHEELQTLRAENTTLTADNARLQAELADRNGQLEAIHRSKTWKIVYQLNHARQVVGR